jgi:hypothetical protein
MQILYRKQAWPLAIGVEAALPAKIWKYPVQNKILKRHRLKTS